jgi:DNA-binding MarR family transcriptional regulator
MLAEVYASLVRTGQVLLAELDRAVDATFGVPLPLMDALAVIDGAGDALTPGQIAERGHTSSATMTATLDTLERLGWAQRRPNPDDRRSVLVEITAEGRSIVDQFLPGVRVLEQTLLAALSDADRKALMRILAKVLASTATAAADPPIALEGRRNRPPL